MREQPPTKLGVSENEFDDDLTALLRAVDDGLFVLDQAGSVLCMSAWLSERVGSQLRGRPFHECITRALRAEFERTLATLTSAGSRSLRVRLDTSHGTGVWVDVRLTRGRFRGAPAIFGVTRQADIGESPATGPALLPAAEGLSFTDAFASSPFCMSLYDGARRLVAVNAAFERATGIAAAEALGKTPFELGLAPQLDDDQQLIRRVAQGGTTDAATVRIRRRDGAMRTHVFCASLLRAGDRSSWLLSVSFDITDYETAELGYRRQDQKFRALCQSLPDGVFFIDSDGTFCDVNEAACRQHGYSADELIGMSVERIAARSDFDYRKVIARLRSSGGQLHYETSHRRKDGTLFPIELSLALIESERDFVMAGIARDLTDKQRAETAQHRLEEQLHQASKMEAVGRLAGGIAHDFNNLLTVVAGYAELLLREHDPASSTSLALNEILAAADRASSLTTQLLAFSRKQIIEPRVIDLNALVEGALRMLERMIGEDVALLFQSEHEPSQVKVDPSQIEQLLINLAVNARDAMPRGGLLKIQTQNITLDELAPMQPDARPGEYVRLIVQDNGVGMSQETLEHVFEPFFSTKERGRGTGLGLSIVYGVIKQNGGFITVHSEVGSGSRFEIHLPRARGALPAVAPPEAWPALLRGEGTVLLVEDEAAVRDVTARFLHNAGYQVIAASCADEALAMLASDSAPDVDVLVTDIVLPGINGRQLHQQLLERLPGLQAVFISGYNDEVIAQHGVVDPHVLFLEKPFTQEALARKVQEARERAGASRGVQY